MSVSVFDVAVHCVWLLVQAELAVCVCVCLHSFSCKVKFVQEQECGVARLSEVVRFDFLLPRN